MLILQRKVGESIVIADNIIITLTEARSGVAKIGITAPQTTPVHRMELIANGGGQARTDTHTDGSDWRA